MAADKKQIGQLDIVVQPMHWDIETQGARPTRLLQLKTQSKINSAPVTGQVTAGNHPWDVEASIRLAPEEAGETHSDPARMALMNMRSAQRSVSGQINLPTGMTEEEMQAVYDARWLADFEELYPVGSMERDQRERYLRQVQQQQEKGYSSSSSKEEEEEEDLIRPYGVDSHGQFLKLAPSKLRYSKVDRDMVKVRALARESKAAEKKLALELEGKPAVHWIQSGLEGSNGSNLNDS